jgi:hypothetical protein
MRRPGGPGGQCAESRQYGGSGSASGGAGDSVPITVITPLVASVVRML